MPENREYARRESASPDSSGRKKKHSHRVSTLFMVIGLLFILGAGSLTAYNVYDDHRADREAGDAADHVQDEIDRNEDPFSGDGTGGTGETPLYQLDPNISMPTISYSNGLYIGMLKIPSLGLNLPVQSDWDYQKLRSSPCRYKGSVYTGDLIIAGHNYPRHFGNLKRLSPGAQVIFTDSSGNVFYYRVNLVDILESTDVQKMEDVESQNWDLTMFTCTIGGRQRVTVRCSFDESNGQ